MNNTAQPITTAFHPLKDLNLDNQKLLEESAQVSQIGTQKRLNASDLRKWYIYLINGTLSVTTDNGDHTKLVGGSPQAQAPIFADDNINGYAVTETTCKVIRFERDLFENLMNDESLSGYEVEDVQINETEGALFQELYTACADQNLQLPTMPEVAMKIARLADDPEAGIPELVQVIQAEPTVAGSILKVANSPLYKGTTQVDNIKNAVIRLGLKITRDLASSVALREAFQVKNPAIKKRMQDLWEHSVNISGFSYVIAKKMDGFDPERALMAGLLHDIGVVAILTHLDRNSLVPDPSELEATIAKLRGMAGLLVLNHWGLDKELGSIVEGAEDWWRDSESSPDYCDILIIAHVCEAAEIGRSEGLPTLAELPAARKIGLDPGEQDLETKIVTEAEQELASVKQALTS